MWIKIVMTIAIKTCIELQNIWSGGSSFLRLVYLHEFVLAVTHDISDIAAIIDQSSKQKIIRSNIVRDDKKMRGGSRFCILFCVCLSV